MFKEMTCSNFSQYTFRPFLANLSVLSVIPMCPNQLYSPPIFCCAGMADSPTASEVSSCVVTPRVESVGSSVGSFLGAPQEAFSRLRTLSSLTGTRSEGDSSSRYRSSAFFSSTPRSDVDSLYSDFGAASSGRFTPRDSSDAIVTSKLLLRLESKGSSGGSIWASAAAILDLIAEVLADILTDQLKGMALVEAAVEAVPLYVGSDTMLVFQGLCLGRMINFLERRLVRDEEEHPKKLDKNRSASPCSIYFVHVINSLCLVSQIDPLLSFPPGFPHYSV